MSSSWRQNSSYNADKHILYDSHSHTRTQGLGNNDVCSTPTSQPARQLAQRPRGISSTRSDLMSGIPDKKRNWRALVVNINGLRDKKASIHAACEYIKPDVLIGCETKVTNEILSTELLPTNYLANSYRKDRNAHGGGVIVAVRDGFTTSELDISVDSEQLWVRINDTGEKSIYVCSMYRPPDSGTAPLDDLDLAIKKINPKPDQTVIVAGDLNCGHINWTQGTVESGAPQAAVNQRLIDVANEHHLTNVQHQPTRQGKALEVFMTNNPSLVKNVS